MSRSTTRAIRLPYWYLSFVEREGPNPRWLGATIVKGRTNLDAVNRAWELGCNPGGEVMMSRVKPGSHIPDAILNRLVSSEDELRSIFPTEDGRDPLVHVDPTGMKCVECEKEATLGQ